MKAQTRRAVAAINDERIISLFEQRNEQALAETTSMYGALCRSVARNILGTNEDAEECFDDALLAAWNAIPPAHPQSLRAYILRLVHNHAVNRWNASKAQKRGGSQLPAALDELSEVLASRESIEDENERREMLEGITQFLRGLPKQQRDLFVRRYWYAATVSELSALFNMTENHVKVTLSRIRKRLQNYLRKEGLL